LPMVCGTYIYVLKSPSHINYQELKLVKTAEKMAFLNCFMILVLSGKVYKSDNETKQTEYPSK